MTAKLIALAAALACLCTTAQAQIIYIVPGGQYPFAGERVMRLDIGKAIQRALTPPSHSAPPMPQAAVPPPPQAMPPQQETREQWRQRLFEEMKNYCSQWPTDTACGPNALRDGSR